VLPYPRQLPTHLTTPSSARSACTTPKLPLQRETRAYTNPQRPWLTRGIPKSV